MNRNTNNYGNSKRYSTKGIKFTRRVPKVCSEHEKRLRELPKPHSEFGMHLREPPKKLRQFIFNIEVVYEPV